MNPLKLFRQDQHLARTAKDPMANLCTVANVDEFGRCQVRTLVLRDVGEDLAIFINATSPKWAHLQEHISLLTYWPSVQKQFRIAGQTKPIESSIVADSWQLRPDPPKRMDWYYTTVKEQSSSVPNRETLLDEVANVALPSPLVAPDSAHGFTIEINSIERLDLSQNNGIHDRCRWELIDQTWQAQTLVP